MKPPMQSHSEVQYNSSTSELPPDFSGLSAALLRSRQTYLSAGLFKSFWSRSATRKSKKNPEGKSNQPEHSLTRLGACDVSFGVHTFPETKFFLAKYLGPSMPSSGENHDLSISATSATPEAIVPKSIPQPQNTSVAPVSDASTRLSFSSISPLQQQAVIEKLNQAARSNPQLMQILSMVANGTASPQQVQVLTSYIQATSTAHSSNQPVETESPAKLKSKQKISKSKALQSSTVIGTDIVFEFRENVSERWTLPKSAILDTSNIEEVLVSFLIVTPPMEGITIHYQPITMTLHNCPSKISDAIREVIDPPEKVVQEMSQTMNKIQRSEVTSEFAVISATVKSEDRYASFGPFSKTGLKRGPYKKKQVDSLKASESTTLAQEGVVPETSKEEQEQKDKNIKRDPPSDEGLK